MREIHRKIVGAVIKTSDNRILLGKQVKGGVWDDCWHIPGGGVEKDESLKDALIREVKEETLLDVTDWEIDLVNDTNSATAEKNIRGTEERVIVHMAFYDYLISTNKNSSEIDLVGNGDGFSDLKWVDIKDLRNIKLTSSEIALFKKLKYL
jgi:8-oxo-dGTP pyrophosphatase MutT (NUDIX family)